MRKIKNFIKNYFSDFAYFYKYLRGKIFFMLSMSLIVGVLDGFGLAFFLPLLQTVSEEGSKGNSAHLGNLSFLVKMLNSVGITLTLTNILIVMFFFFLAKGFFKFLENSTRVKYQQHFMQRIRTTNISLLAEFNYEKFINTDIGRIQNTLSGEVERLNIAFQNYMKVLQFGVLVLVYSSLAFLANPQFAILVTLGGIFTNILFGKLKKATKAQSKELTGQNNEFQGLLIQQVTQFKYLKSTGLIKKYAEKLIHKVRQIEISQRRIGIFNAIVQGTREPLLVGVVVAVILIQVNFLNGSLGLILLSIVFFYRALNFVMQLQTNWNIFLGVTGSLENTTEFTEFLKKGREKVGTISIKSFNNNIVFKNVSFVYGERYALKDINLSISKSETIAIVGESGSGKTTLVNILTGLIKPSSGLLLIDGIDSREIDLKSYQNKIGYITQEPVIFSDTIFNNVTFWDDKTPENFEKFINAVKKASIYDFIMELPEQENTSLGSVGVNLSGGQKQRISIAREFYKNVEIFIMDEATSALDSQTEKDIQNSIESLKGIYTTVIVAHRLSTVKIADRIVFMKDGMIENIGSYNELLTKSVSFKSIVALQNL